MSTRIQVIGCAAARDGHRPGHQPTPPTGGVADGAPECAPIGLIDNTAVFAESMVMSGKRKTAVKPSQGHSVPWF